MSALGHIIVLMIAHLDANAFFSPRPQKAFHSWATLAAAASSDAGFAMLDEMCDNERGPKRRAADQTWFQRGASRKHRNKDMLPVQRHLCDALEILMNGIQQSRSRSTPEQCLSLEG